MSSIRIAGVVNDSIVDGEGYRYAIFTQGCPHKCQGCHNPQTHDFNGGCMADTADLLREIDENMLLSGVTFSGGEPFCQAGPLAELAAEIHQRDLSVWCYTGYTLEKLWEKAQAEPEVGRLLEEIDVLVDGPFIEAQKNLNLPFRGSDNQRIIDMVETRIQGQIVLRD